MSYAIGIDTGGTYTDAVLYDQQNRKVIASAKALTTRGDLSVGILNALDRLPSELSQKVEVICLSTTLATNACVEDKGARSKLLFIGVDPRAVAWVGRDAGLDDPELIRYAPDAGWNTTEDWASFVEELRPWLDDAQALGVVSLNPAKDQGAAERAAADAVAAQWKFPVICGHELSDILNSIHRGTSALLNGKLVPVLAEFLDSIEHALKQRNISAPVAIMSSGGSLMSTAFSESHPVETILCGPAASAAGGRALSAEENAIVVDMGGTTTDIALIRDGIPVKASQGVKIGRWHTATKGVFVHTLGLGGDSAIRYDWRTRTLSLGPERVIPLCSAAARWPEVTEHLSALVEKGTPQTVMVHEFYLRIRNIEGNPQYTPKEHHFCQLLGDKPMPIRQAAEAMGEDHYAFRMSRLEQEGVIIRCGLTPTDIMHVTGDFTAFSVTAARLGTEFLASCMGITAEKLCTRVYDDVKRRLYLNIADILLQEEMPLVVKQGLTPQLTAYLERAWAQYCAGTDSQLRIGISTSSALIGVGAPIHVFLPDVAKALGTRCIIPDHAPVVNAAGAAACNVTATKTVSITPDGTRYLAHLSSGPVRFEELEEALVPAREESAALARQEALSRGADGQILVRYKENIRTTVTGYGNDLFLGADVTATAIGTFSF